MRPLLRFSRLGGNYDALPSPSNLHRWNITSKTSCKLCHKQIPTLAHVHGTCKFGLQEEQGHFLTWLYSSDAFFLYFDLFQHHTIKRNTSIKFLKAWSKPWQSIRSKIKLLRFSPDWKLRFELNNLVLPSFIAMCQWRQYVVYSVSTKTDHFRTHLPLWGKHVGVALQKYSSDKYTFYKATQTLCKN